jgi:D-aminoacyl-tRNA deacylase
MRAVIQRVEKASVTVEGTVVGAIARGLMVLLAIEKGDGQGDLDFIKRKILNLRVFEDAQGKMSRSLLQEEGQLLLISQFTLYGDCRKGNRPSYSRAALPAQAENLYRELIERIRMEGVTVESGTFLAMMKVSLVNDGPVTLIVDSKKE